MLQISDIEKKKHKKLMLVWCITFLILFPLLILLGLTMRLNQGDVIKLDPGTFYALMTLHGLGMAGVLFSFTLAGLHYLIGTRYAKVSISLGYTLYFLILFGTIGLAVATLIGKFAAGWYLLYPLTFKGTSWESWATALSLVSLIVLGVAWLIGSTHIVHVLAKKYGGIVNTMGWQYFKKEKPSEELPSIALISTISLVPAILSFIVGAVFLILNLLQHFEPSLMFDPLLLKNLVFFFGHTLVNVTMYCAVGWVYCLLPEYTKRDWGVNKVVAISWNGSFFFIMFAYFHHLYMDFSQPTSIQYAGQIASYLSALPATVVTMFGIIAQLYHSKIKWSIIPMAFLLGMGGWAIGGFAALVDTTISINKVLHNTLWVPAHFHTYMLMGVVLFIFGFLYYLAYAEQEVKQDPKQGLGFWIFIIGAYGFLIMFYLGGMHSVPRRYDSYNGISVGKVHQNGAMFAETASVFISILLIGLLIMYITLISRLIKSKNK